MSNFAKMLKATPTHQRVAMMSPLSEVLKVSDEWESIPFTDASVYRVGVAFQSTVALTETEMKQNPNAIKQALRDTKQHLVETLFGEFRGPISRIRQTLYQGDLQKARALVNELETQMFSVEAA